MAGSGRDISSSVLDLARREADIAIRAMPKVPDSSLGRKVCDFRFAVYASPAYLERNPGRPLAEHDWVMIEGVADWFVPMIWKPSQAADQQTVFTSSGPAVVEAAEAGMGLSRCPATLPTAGPPWCRSRGRSNR